MKYGYHLSTKKPLHKTISKDFNNASMPISAYQIFLKTPRQKILSKISDDDANKCKEFIQKNQIYLVAHSSYLLNIATEIIDNNDMTLQSAIDDLLTIEKIGGVGAVFHVGKHLNRNISKCIDNMYNFIIRTINSTADSNSKFILETGAGCGTELCTSIEELGNFYNRFNNKYKKRVKICIDTCHVFSAGHDLRTRDVVETFISDVEEYIGWKNVEVIHLNDSKRELGCRVDRHEHLCKGYIGKDGDGGFQRFIDKCKEEGLPTILETPDDGIRINDLLLIQAWIGNKN